MNLRIVRALLWEQYLCTRAVFVVAAVFGVASAIVAAVIRSAALSDSWEIVSINLLAWSHIFTGFSILALLLNPRDGFDFDFAIPNHHRSLPVHSLMLAACRLGFGMASIGLLTVIVLSPWALIVDGYSVADLCSHALVCAVAYASIQALIAVVVPLGLRGPLVPVTSIVLYVGFALKTPRGLDLMNNSSDIGLLLLPSLVALGVVWAAIHFQRHGALWHFDTLLPAIPRRFPIRSRTRVPFSSPTAALRWYEFRRQAWLIPFVFAVAIATVVAFFFSMAVWLGQDGPYSDPMELIAETAIPIATGLFIAVSMCCGIYFLGQDGKFQYLSMRPFHFDLPVSTNALADGQIAARQRAMGMVAVPIALALLAREGYGIYVSKSGTGDLINAFVSYAPLFLAFLLAGWTLLWTVESFAFMAISLLFGAMFTVRAAIAEAEWAHPWSPWFLILALNGVTIAALARLFREHRGHNLLRMNPRIVAPVLVLCILAYILAGTAAMPAFDPAIREAVRTSCFVPLAYAIPLLPFFVQPLIIHPARHQ